MWGAPKSDDRRGRASIDTILNLGLLFWASKETGAAMRAGIATVHALNHNTRLDGSTAHVMGFDPDTGEFIKQDTHQGLSPTSCWARGQARV